MTKAEYENLSNLQKAFHNENIPCTKSQILEQAFKEYVRAIVAVGMAQTKQTEKQNQGEERKC